MRKLLTAALLATSMLGLPTVAHAQAMTAEEAAQLRAELAALKAQVQTLETRLDAATAQPATTAAPVTTPAPTPTVSAKPATEISWKGAPELKTADGWSFKPRGRMQLDVAGVDAPGRVSANSLGVGTEFRRLYLGMEGKIPGGFGYRIEADFANSSVELTDAYLTYSTGPLTITAGQAKPFWSLEELTSDLFTSFNERAAFTQAFGFERRVGLSAQYKAKSAMLQLGVFGDNANDLTSDSNNSVSFDARAVFMPKIGKTQLHLAGSGHFRNFNDTPNTTRYRARPFVHTTDVRIVDTGPIGAFAERGFGAEAAALRGPFHVAGEAFWQTARRNGLPDPTFFGGYVEAGLVLTPGDGRTYKDGAFDRLAPSKGIDQGGIGAIEVNVRYDYLDLIDKGIVGGKQRTAGISLVWAPIQYVRIIANYGRLSFDQAAVAAAGDRDYSADAFGLRTQVDF